MFELNVDSNLSIVVVKIVFLIISVLYLFYTFVVVRQIAVMKKTLITGFSDVISLLGYIMLILSAITTLVFIIWL